MFSGAEREAILQAMAQETYDVLIIGGGITGAGIALDAQSRGLRTALVEMQDFAAGTSSRSTKLVHGGLRYLKQLEVRMVAEVGKERAIVYDNGPHITKPEWMLLPLYKGGTFGKLSTSLGLRFYDYLAGVRAAERRIMLSAEQTAAKEPLLRRHGLQGGGYYVEYRTDDARLTIEVLKKAVELGARAVNYAKAVELLYEPDSDKGGGDPHSPGRLAGVRVADQWGGGSYTLRAGAVINAAGPWVDTLREQDGSKQGSTLHHTKGVHLVFDQARFPLRQAVYFDTPDGRMVFAIPRDGKTYAGTTDTDYRGDLAHPRMTAEDRSYLLAAVNAMFPSLGLTADDVESSWTGLRPLIHQAGRSPSEISRRDEIFVSPSGLISIAGGKLTGYRKMAETVVDRAAALLAARGRAPAPPSRTRTLPLSGGDVGGAAGLAAYVRRLAREGERLGLAAAEAELLAQRYGSNAAAVLALAQQLQGEAAAYGLPVSWLAALVYAMEHEMAVTPADVFIRRTGALFFDIAAVRRWQAPAVAFMAARRGWSAARRQALAAALERELRAAVEPLE